MLPQCLQKLSCLLTYRNSSILTIPKQIFFETVKNTNKYSEFIPWCTSSNIDRVLSQNQNFTTLTISFNQLKHISYTSHVTIEEKENYHIITSICKQYPLKQLKSVWTLRKVSEGRTEVDYFLDFQFDSLIYQLTSSIFLNIMGKSMWDVFVDRAKRNHFLTKQKTSFSSKQSQKTTESSALKEGLKEGKFDFLSDYLDKRPKIFEIYRKNAFLRVKIDTFAQRFNNTNSFDDKLDFQIKNLFIHHSIPYEDSYFN